MTDAKSLAQLPMSSDRMIGAACSLGADELRQRLTDWRGLRERATADPIPGGVRLMLPPDEPIADVAALVSLESACCAFYRFTLRVEGGERQLEISAGPGAEPAVHALLGMDA
jgi:hypothetical protein